MYYSPLYLQDNALYSILNYISQILKNITLYPY